MASVASQLIEKVTAHAQSDSLEDAREICTDGTYFPNNLRTLTGFQSAPPNDTSRLPKIEFHCIYTNIVFYLINEVKGKMIPLQARCGPEGG